MTSAGTRSDESGVCSATLMRRLRGMPTHSRRCGDVTVRPWGGKPESLKQLVTRRRWRVAFTRPKLSAHIARARIHTFYQQGDVARKKAALARELVARNGSERERSHVETLALAVEGQIRKAESYPGLPVTLNGMVWSVFFGRPAGSYSSRRGAGQRPLAVMIASCQLAPNATQPSMVASAAA